MTFSRLDVVESASIRNMLFHPRGHEPLHMSRPKTEGFNIGDYEMKGSPAEYQVEAVNKAVEMKSFGVFFEQRVGKTRVGIDFAGALYVKEGLRRCLIVGPVSAMQAQSAGNAGFSLARSSKVIFYSISFSLVEYKQARDRVMGRAQQSGLVTYYFITAQNTVDEKVIADIRAGIDVASQVVDRFRYYLEE